MGQGFDLLDEAAEGDEAVLAPLPLVLAHSLRHAAGGGSAIRRERSSVSGSQRERERGRVGGGDRDEGKATQREGGGFEGREGGSGPWVLLLLVSFAAGV